ncbi:hypothetical protein EB077_11610, partial [bacterium]|nr:hypothetical protein [bacterium]
MTVTTKAPGSFSTVSNTTYSTAPGIQTQLVVLPPPPPPPAPDPISQTFLISNADGKPGVYLTKLDLYFKQKSSTAGISVQIRGTTNGYPNGSILGKKYLNSSSVSVSDNGSIATTVEFDTPVYLTAGNEYSFVVTPDGGNLDYLMWTAEVGVADLSNPALISNGSWGTGVLFLSSNDTVWTPVQTEDIKFKLYVANFTKSNGTLVMENQPYEFLSLSGVDGSFAGSEEVAQKASVYVNSTITCNTTSQVVNTSATLASLFSVGDYALFVYGANSTPAKTGTVSVASTSTVNVVGTSTSFTTEYTVGDYIRIGSSIREVTQISNTTLLSIDAPLHASVSANVHYGVSDTYQVQQILAANSSTITVKDLPSLTVDNSAVFVGVQKVVRGVVDVVNPDDTIVLKDSNAANTSFRFVAGNKIVGERSGASALVSSVDDVVVNYGESHILDITPPTTSLSFAMDVAATTSTRANTSIVEGISNKIKYEAEVKSRSNEIVSGAKSLKFFTDLTSFSEFNTVSPAIDLYPASVVTLNNIINNDSTDEYTKYGSAKVRYISKSVVLADGLDAEDMKVYLTAYRPSTSNILVYAKIISADDSAVFEDKDWTLMDQVTDSKLYSDSLNDQNYIE